ncbi:MAG: class I SAM-dependent methyltransferase [Candidatus Pacebacteria bacterium]|nr:class I SAM-dependent methyltransferase [Candidatus Paceibacterota bacterium]
MKLLGPYSFLTNTRLLVRRNIRKFIIENTTKKHYKHVVDIGVGKAPYKKLIKHDVYTGVDIEDRGGVENVLIEDLNEGLSLPDNIADLIIITEVLEHIKQPQKAVNELYRVLKKGGECVITVPFVWEMHEVPNDFFRYTYFGIEHLLKEAGFKSYTVTPSSGHWYTMCQIALIRLRSKWFIPIVVCMNLLGIFVHKFEKNGNFPLGFFVVAKK